MTDHSRPDAGEPSVLEQLGFTSSPQPGNPSPTPIAQPSVQQPSVQQPSVQQPAVQQPATRREARATQRSSEQVTRTKPAKRTRSAERRIRALQKTYAATSANRAPRNRPASSTVARTIGSRILSVAAMLFAGALAVGMSMPANAFNSGGDALLVDASASATQATQKGQQTLDIASSVTTSSTARESYTVTSWAEMLRLQYGARDYSYEMGDPNGPIRWPFPYPVPISSGFGERAAPCRGCSSMHMGVDFTPGEGAPIYAIADGVVKVHDDDSGGYGNHVYIDHGNLLGDGNNIQSLYAHMQHGSSPLKVGDTVKVGDFVGTVGRTGTATGNHLHFEVLVNEVQVDPFAWLRANT